MTRQLALAVALGALTACGESISPDPIGDYTDLTTEWNRIETSGPAPGHGDTIRFIYFNEVARGMGTRELGAILVKEVYEDDGGVPGALRYVAMMRKVRRGISPDDEGGWLFSQADTPGGAESHSDTCWNRCHVQAPVFGVWFDYTQYDRPTP